MRRVTPKYLLNINKSHYLLLTKYYFSNKVTYINLLFETLPTKIKNINFLAVNDFENNESTSCWKYFKLSKQEYDEQLILRGI